MNRTHTIRIAWKDYRRLRGFWLALVAFWIFGLGMTSYVALLDQGSAARIQVSHALICILVAAMFYGLGWAGITFSSEHEENTFGFLRSLPVTANSVFYGKLLYGALSTVLLIVALVLLCFLHGLLMGGLVSYEWGFDELAARLAWTWGASIPLAIALGLFWSLRVQRPLLAIALAGGSMVLVCYAGLVAVAVLAWAAGWYVRELEPELAWLTPVCLVAAALLFFVDRKLAQRWLPTFESAFDYAASKKAAIPSAAIDVRVQSPLGFHRLMWLHVRQSWLATLVLGAIGIFLAFVGTGSFAAPQVLALVVVGLLGVTVFRHEHEQDRYRLLGQFSVRGFPYWVSRVVLPILVAIVISALVAATAGRSFAAPSGSIWKTHWGYNWPAAWMTFLGGVATFALAQFCSLAFRSVIIAVAATLMSSVLLWWWFTFCLLLGLPAWLALVPAVVLPLMGSYLRVPRWFRDTGSWKQWLVPAVPLLLLILGVPIASACFRIFEVPLVQLPFDESERHLWLGEPPSATAEATGEAYVNVFNSVNVPDFAESADTGDAVYKPNGKDVLRSAISYPGDWVIDPELVDELMMLASGEECVFPIQYNTTDRIFGGAGLLLADAAMKSRNGKLDDAWSRYQAVLRLARHRNDGRSGAYGALTAYEIERAVYRELVPWAMETGNSATQIEDATNWLNGYRGDQPSWTSILKGDYAQTTQLIEDPESFWHLMNPHEHWQFSLLRPLAPWEFERARRLRDYFTERSYRRLAAMETNPPLIADGWDYGLEEGGQWITTTMFPMHMAQAVGAYGSAAAHIEHERRGVIYQLAAIAHYLKTGGYPASFNDPSLARSLAIPDDLFGTGKMVLAAVPNNAAKRDLYIASTARRPYGQTPAGDTMNQRFRLPDFDNWDRDAFQRQLDSPEDERLTIPTDEHLFDVGGYGAPLDEAVVDTFDPLEVLSTLEPEALRDAAKYSIRNSLTKGNSSQRKSLIEKLVFELQLAQHFVPELARCVDDPDARVAFVAARALKAAIDDGDFNPDDVKGQLESSDAGHDGRDIGIPIKNPANNHYYELLEDNLGSVVTWSSAMEAASERRFRGTQGHLVTITSQAENDFLVKAFGAEGAFWAGASDAEEEGVWKWVCGPEQGRVFWKGAGTDGEAIGYQHWRAGLPDNATSDEDFLVWNWPVASEPGTWNDLDGGSVAWNETVAGYIVEYSPPETPTEVDRVTAEAKEPNE